MKVLRNLFYFLINIELINIELKWEFKITMQNQMKLDESLLWNLFFLIEVLFKKYEALNNY